MACAALRYGSHCATALWRLRRQGNMVVVLWRRGMGAHVGRLVSLGQLHTVHTLCRVIGAASPHLTADL